MNKQILFSLLALIVLFSCNQHQDKPFYELTEVEIIKLPLPHKGVRHAHTWRTFTENGRDYALIYYYPYYNLVKYDLQTREIVKEFPIPKHFYMVFSFDYINHDSIWVLGAMEQSLAVDSQLVLINDRGEINKIANVKGKYLINQQLSDKISEDMEHYKEAVDTLIQPYWSKLPMYSHQKLIFGFYNDNIGTKSDIQEMPMIGVYDIPKDSFYFNSQLDILDRSYYYYNVAYYPYIEAQENIVTFSLVTSEDFMEWNTSSNTYQKYQLPSKYLDTIYHSSKPIPNGDIALSKLPGYLNPIYLQNGKKIIRPVILSGEYAFRWTFIVADSNKYVLDEFISPIKSVSTFKGKLCDDELVNDSCVITLYDIVATNKNHHTEEKLKAIKDSVKALYQDMGCQVKKKGLENKDIEEYLIKREIIDTSCSVIIINSSGCPSCNQSTLEFLSTNQAVLFRIQSKPLHFVYVDENSKRAKAILKEAGLQTSAQIQIDTSNIYETFYSGGEMNPRLILKKDNQVVHDSIYNPDVIGQLPLDLLNYYGFGYEKREE